MEKTLVTSGQKRQLIGVLIHRFVEEINDLLDSGEIHNIQQVLAQGGELVKHLSSEMRKKIIELSEYKIGYLQLVSDGEEVIISETSGIRNVVNSSNVFRYVDQPRLKMQYDLDTAEGITTAVEVRVYQPFKNGTPLEVFCGFGENLDRLCLTQDQIITFAEKNSQWIPKGKSGVLFLSKISDEHFIFTVDWFGWSKNKLRVKVRHLSSEGCQLYKELGYRVVVPVL